MDMQQWFVHLQGMSLGPLTTENVVLMLQQNRLQFVDYIWANGLTKWHRICDLDQFAALMPAYPKAGIPKTDGEKAEPVKSSYIVDPPEPKLPDAPVAPVTPVAASPSASVPQKQKENKPKTKVAQTRSYRRIAEPEVQVIINDRHYKAINLSETGILLRAEKPLDVGLEIDVDLTLPGDKILKLTAVVIRHEDSEKGTGFAIEFTRVNPAHKRLLREYIEKCSN